MNASENTADALRSFGKDRFGSMRNFADKLGMTPQSLQSYLSGKRTPGRGMMEKLNGLGFDVSVYINKPDVLSEAAIEATIAPDWKGIEILLGRSLSDSAPLFFASKTDVASWTSGRSSPSPVQLTRLLNFLVGAMIAMRGHTEPLHSLPASTISLAAGSR